MNYLKYTALILFLIAAAAHTKSNYISNSSNTQNNSNISNISTISFLNVGQGDGIHIRTSTAVDVVIDGGPGDSIVAELGNTMPFWDRTIELLVISHPDADHITGFVPLLEYYHVQQVLLVDLSIQSAVHEELITQLAEQGTQVLVAQSGQQIQLSDKDSMQVLYPFANTSQVELETMARNDTSIVFEYMYSGSERETRVLFTGDIAKPVEQELMEVGIVRDVDVLKVAHHGSKSSSAASFLEAANPELSVIQSGADNTFGHPHQEVLDRLQPYGPILRNDELGTIHICIHDQGYQVCDWPTIEFCLYSMHVKTEISQRHLFP